MLPRTIESGSTQADRKIAELKDGPRGSVKPVQNENSFKTTEEVGK
jgi:hypothetical protein